MFGLVLYLTGNFVCRICFRTFVFRSFVFFIVKILFFGRRLCFLIVLNAFLSI